ncbi:MAG: transposase, partial [Candidatus Sericytochromatia bacterium]|nr:transposase [Candidatus Tanganyikabacteria bacterium]
NADIKREEADDQVLRFLAFWKGIQRGVQPTLVFDSRFTAYSQLSELNAQGVKFITLRRRGKKLLDEVDALSPWQRIHVPHAKRKYPNPEVHESTITLRGYDGNLRQAVVRGNGHEKPSFLISNDFEAPIDLLVGNYARRWRVENGIAEAVKFFHLNALSSPILTKVHFDVVMTAVADTLYAMLAKKLRGFEDCDAPKLYRHFIRGQSTVGIENGEVVVTFARQAHNPILRDAPWDHQHLKLAGLDGAPLAFRFL